MKHGVDRLKSLLKPTTLMRTKPPPLTKIQYKSNYSSRSPIINSTELLHYLLNIRTALNKKKKHLNIKFINSKVTLQNFIIFLAPTRPKSFSSLYKGLDFNLLPYIYKKNVLYIPCVWFISNKDYYYYYNYYYY